MIAQIYAWAAGGHQHYGLYDDGDDWARCAIEFGTKHSIPFSRAMGYEFLGENAVNKGNYEAGLKYATHEREIADKLNSRERLAWISFYSSHCHLGIQEFDRAEAEFMAGITLAELVGEKRVLALLKSNYAVLIAQRGRYDEALRVAQESFDEVGSTNLLYSRFEALRCLASVRFHRALAGITNVQEGLDELSEAERICKLADELVGPTESRVSQLWLGPLYLDVLLEQKRRAETEDNVALAARKLSEAKQRLNTYQELVAQCQSPRFTAEAARIAELLATE